MFKIECCKYLDGIQDCFVSRGGKREGAIFIGLLLKTGRKKRGKKKREIIERPRAAIDANKAAEHKLSEEMRRLISLLDLDSFLRPPSLSLSLSLFRLPLSLSYLDSATGEKYTGTRLVSRISRRLFVYRCYSADSQYSTFMLRRLAWKEAAICICNSTSGFLADAFGKLTCQGTRR